MLPVGRTEMPNPCHTMLLALVLAAACSCSSDEDTSSSPMTGGANVVQSDVKTGSWVASEDGLLALRIAAENREVEGDEPIVLVVEIANRGSVATPIIKPFGDRYYAEAVGVALEGPRGSVKYTGPTPSYVIGPMAFLWLETGESFTDRLTLRTDNFAGSDAPAEYTARYTYKYAGEWDSVDGARSAWRGQIVSPQIRLTRR